MWISHTDYVVPGIGEPVEVTRFYNSVVQTAGLFGHGWSTKFDESLVFINSQVVRWNRSDGKAVYFGREFTSQPWRDFSKEFMTLVDNGDTTFSVKDRVGKERRFNQAGRLLSLKDRNGNTTALTYDANQDLIAATDQAGRTLTFTPNANGTISEISDSSGSIATYEYESGTTRLKTVTFADGSKYKLTYITVAGKTVLTTVKDALDNVLEYHEYDTSARAITSEKQGGQEKFTFSYQTLASFYRQTTVTDGLGRVMNYWFLQNGGEWPLEKVEGTCCGQGGSETAKYFYDNDLNVKRRTDAFGRPTDFTYDSSGNKLTEIDYLGTQKWTYNTFGEVLTYQDRIDSQANPIVYTAANTFDTNGNLLTHTDALGKVTTLTYPTTNNKGLPESIKDARNSTTKFKWFSSGLLNEIEDPYTKKTKFTHDARGRTKTITNALNHVTQ